MTFSGLELATAGCGLFCSMGFLGAAGFKNLESEKIFIAGITCLAFSALGTFLRYASEGPSAREIVNWTGIQTDKLSYSNWDDLIQQFQNPVDDDQFEYFIKKVNDLKEYIIANQQTVPGELWRPLQHAWAHLPLPPKEGETLREKVVTANLIREEVLKDLTISKNMIHKVCYPDLTTRPPLPLPHRGHHRKHRPTLRHLQNIPRFFEDVLIIL